MNESTDDCSAACRLRFILNSSLWVRSLAFCNTVWCSAEMGKHSSLCPPQGNQICHLLYLMLQETLQHFALMYPFKVLSLSPGTLSHSLPCFCVCFKNRSELCCYLVFGTCVPQVRIDLPHSSICILDSSLDVALFSFVVRSPLMQVGLASSNTYI